MNEQLISEDPLNANKSLEIEESHQAITRVEHDFGKN